ncbi:hypothetical protein O3M35_002666 [Rhynocoris fuscipes]|uniref:Ig-like domain-containing protein n=1 Tax=Rhynocoris fuscipes TaxID=488301 RepID=A0AAW1CTQ6_9HEMI
MKHFVRITSSTEGVINVKQGEPFELECVAVGSYSPSLDWYKDGVRVTDGEDNNYISRFDVTRGIIRYIVDCAQPKHSGSYSCEAVTGTVTASSPQQVRVHVSRKFHYLLYKMSPRLMKSGGVCRQDQQLPRITRYSPVVMQNIGTDVKLVCRTQGFPRPDVYWTDKSGNILDTSAGSRFKILDSGDLIIKSVRWPDMGNYMCAAENRFGKDITSTFLYPMMVSYPLLIYFHFIY